MKDALGHGSNTRGGGRKPIPNHPYHAKTDAELRYIQRDATEAGRNAQGMGDERGVNKYADQVNDAATVLGYRARGGKSDAPGDQLASGPKSAPAPVHDSMSGSSRDTDAFGRPRSEDSKREYDEYSRDLSLRSRNGQVGSGMKYRG